jgi:predicted HTH domain antitoxin
MGNKGGRHEHGTAFVRSTWDILDSARMTLEDLKVELAIALYAQGRLSIGEARELAELSLWDFRQSLASRSIPAHFDEADLQEDAAAVGDRSVP